MSRSGFHEMEDWDRESILSSGRVRGQVASASRGKRGQAFLKTALAALDNMEDKRLSGGTFGVKDGCMCFMTSIATETGRASVFSGVRNRDDDGEGVCENLAQAFDVAPVLIKDLVWDNDEYPYDGPADRWGKMRARVANSIASPTEGGE